MTTVRITDDTDPTLVLDVLEARVRRLMAERAALPLRWDTRARRDELSGQVQDALDEWLLAR